MTNQNKKINFVLGVAGTIAIIVVSYLIYQIIIKLTSSPCDKINQQTTAEISSSLNILGQEGKIIIGEKNLNILNETSLKLALNLQNCCIMSMQGKFKSEEILKCIEISNGNNVDFQKSIDEMVGTLAEIKQAQKEKNIRLVEQKVNIINQNLNKINIKIESDKSLSKEKLTPVSTPILDIIDETPRETSPKLFIHYDSKSKKIGYVNHNNIYLIPPKFEDAFPFDENNAIVNFNNSWGVINMNGEYVLRPIYGSIELYNEYFLASKGKDFLIFDRQGKFVDYLNNKITYREASEAIKNSDFSEKDMILRIISSNSDEQARDQELIKMAFAYMEVRSILMNLALKSI
jgi:hypothetical protein